MLLSVKLQAFEGPLDLLLHLIDKNKINIYDIPIVLITEQYLEYVNAMDKTDLDTISEFLVMAATLLDIKARMLLPKEVNEEGEEEDPRAELVERLLEYKMYKYMSYELRDRQVDAQRSLYKPATIPCEVEEYKVPPNPYELLEDVTLKKLNDIFNECVKRQEDKIDPVRSKFGRIEKEEVNMEEQMSNVRRIIDENESTSFRKLLLKGTSKMQVIVTFLVVLELIKIGYIAVEQEKTFDDILITKRTDVSANADDIFKEGEKAWN